MPVGLLAASLQDTFTPKAAHQALVIRHVLLPLKKVVDLGIG
jgi:hypothetical protein